MRSPSPAMPRTAFWRRLLPSLRLRVTSYVMSCRILFRDAASMCKECQIFTIRLVGLFTTRCVVKRITRCSRFGNRAKRRIHRSCATFYTRLKLTIPADPRVGGYGEGLLVTAGVAVGSYIIEAMQPIAHNVISYTFLGVYGIPSIFLVGPPNTPENKEAALLSGLFQE